MGQVRAGNKGAPDSSKGEEPTIFLVLTAPSQPDISKKSEALLEHGDPQLDSSFLFCWAVCYG